MTKKSFTEGNWRTDPWFRNLCGALASCKTTDQVAAFLRDVGTLTELQAWSERFEVARLIAGGKTYRDITDITGASTTTVTRVARYVQGEEGGYRNVLGNLHTSAPRASRKGRHGGHRKREEMPASNV